MMESWRDMLSEFLYPPSASNYPSYQAFFLNEN